MHSLGMLCVSTERLNGTTFACVSINIVAYVQVKMKKCRNAGERTSLRNDMKSLRKELRQREEAATKGILKRAQVVLSTLTGLSEIGPLKVLDESHFDLVVIDECSQVGAFT